MKRFGEAYEVSNFDMEVIATYMISEIREELHNQLAPCSNERFLIEYVKRDPMFETLLKDEFSIEL